VPRPDVDISHRLSLDLAIFALVSFKANRSRLPSESVDDRVASSMIPGIALYAVTNTALAIAWANRGRCNVRPTPISSCPAFVATMVSYGGASHHDITPML
jgi:hypothetical protein